MMSPIWPQLLPNPKHAIVKKVEFFISRHKLLICNQYCASTSCLLCAFIEIQLMPLLYTGLFVDDCINRQPAGPVSQIIIVLYVLYWFIQEHMLHLVSPTVNFDKILPQSIKYLYIFSGNQCCCDYHSP